MSFESSLGIDRQRPTCFTYDESAARWTILGGGIAGLAAAFYAVRRGLPVTVYEAGRRAGGLCVTFTDGDFRFDAGAHRFHDKDVEITEDVRTLLGPSLRPVDRPSMIFDAGRLLRFPFRLRDVVLHLSAGEVARGAMDLASARLGRGRGGQRSFEDLAVGRYGRRLAERFLLGYSLKLWGLPGDRLSARISGGRLRGLDLRQFLLHTLLGRRGDRRSLDGAFQYPTLGIGMLPDALARVCGPGAVRTAAEVLRVFHDGRRIRAIEVAGEGRRMVGDVSSTLPLESLLTMMYPPPPAEILRKAEDLRYRDLVLVALFLAKESVTSAATVYFPDPRLPFTRITEPRNRSEAMAPPGRTSLVAEIPCAPGDGTWSSGDDELVRSVRTALEEIGWIRDGELLGSRVVRLRHAYPVLSLEVDRSLAGIRRYLEGFENLELLGRNGKFEYGWIHDMLRGGKDLVASRSAAPRR